MKKKNKNNIIDSLFKSHPELESKINEFLIKCKNEGNEYSEVFILIKKGLSGKNLSHKEQNKIWEQLLDTLKISGNVILFMLPLGSILLPLLLTVAKKYHIDILPSSFNQKNKSKK
jgi:hypothetical protein